MYKRQELWQELGFATSVHQAAWPQYNGEALKRDEIEVVLQINGKVRGRVTLPASLSQAETQEAVLALERTKELVEGKTVVKVICVPGKLVNIVVK